MIKKKNHSVRLNLRCWNITRRYTRNRYYYYYYYSVCKYIYILIYRHDRRAYRIFVFSVLIFIRIPLRRARCSVKRE